MKQVVKSYGTIPFYGAKCENSSANVDPNQSANSSIVGFISDLSAALNDSHSQIMNGSDFLSLSKLDALVGDENGDNSISDNVGRSRRNIKKKEYSEGACNETDDISFIEYDDDVIDKNFCPKRISDSVSDSDSDSDSDNDSENLYVPRKKSKLELNSATILQSTPKRRGRPPGVKNGKGKKIQVQKIKLHLGNKVRQRVKKVM